jgi:hypothetical protein
MYVIFCVFCFTVFFCVQFVFKSVLFVFKIVLFLFKSVLYSCHRPAVNPFAVNKYVISYQNI